MDKKRKALLLSIGYGQGHHAAAAAVAQELEHRGWCTLTVDPCVASHPHIFAITQRFYHFCVRKMPWLWGVTYEQTDSSDWSRQVHMPLLRDCTRKIQELLEAERPDVCICTYPLFAYMLDAINSGREHPVPYAVVITDALEISRPWALSKTPLLCVPDAHSRRLLLERYALPQENTIATGFPVRSEFLQPAGRELPRKDNLRIVYGAYAPIGQVEDDLTALFAAYPACHITVLAGDRLRAFRSLAKRHAGQMTLIRHTDAMSALFSESHIYIGKAGASTMFEAYASGLPAVVNYALPGQEQGNTQLLLEDGCGFYVEGTEDLLHVVGLLLANSASLWRRISTRMREAGRAAGAQRIADAVERGLLRP